MRSSIFLGIAALGSVLPATAATYHVSPQPLPGIAVELQYRTIAEAARKVAAGDVVKIHNGTYREAVLIEAKGSAERPIRFEAAQAAHVVVTGADRLDDWRKEEAPAGENVYSTPWPHRFIAWSETGTHPADDYHRLIGRAEQVFINGYALLQVLSREKLGRGTFYVDHGAKRLFLQASNNAKLGGDQGGNQRVEASVRGTIWDVRGDHVHTRGLIFRYGATQAQSALARLGGRGDIIEDCSFEGSNADGATFGNEHQVARRCTFRDNGQDGFTGGAAHDLLVSDCLTRNNNTKNFDRGWGAGGCKIVMSRGVVIEGSQFLDNRGVGIWFDIGNEETTIRNCLIARNEDAGIFYEISYGLHAHDNVILENGLLSSAGAWGANGGIALSSSPRCVIERNLLVANKEGFQFREQPRRTPRIGRAAGQPEEWVWNHDETIQHNVLAWNRDAQAWGWWAAGDDRHRPRVRRSADPNRAGSAPETDIARPYRSAPDGGAPRDLSLESLALRLRGNVYDPEPGQGLFHWGPAWQDHRRFRGLDEVRDELGLEADSIVAQVEFADYHRRDLRVPADSPALRMQAYPRGEVPGVTLGTRPAP
ncbi:right-handed parallel beta-helix repeat-containing protein [Aquisphaera insulae]|uniref:right-handed parallel beta-helix repeat-containing protein n=1 Tax=Aquisphaera insulae TaxID=2712864 RepID=UPI0013ED8CA9|nr:right-handed parallel beta-helix repeat-containing protein [Aquisphaera insulae]